MLNYFQVPKNDLQQYTQAKDLTSMRGVAASAMQANPSGNLNSATSRPGGVPATSMKDLLGAAQMAMAAPEPPQPGPEAGPSVVQPAAHGPKPRINRFNVPKRPQLDPKQLAHTEKIKVAVANMAKGHGVETSEYIEKIMDDADAEKDVENPLTKRHGIETTKNWTAYSVVAGYNWDADTEWLHQNVAEFAVRFLNLRVSHYDHLWFGTHAKYSTGCEYSRTQWRTHQRPPIRAIPRIRRP